MFLTIQYIRIGQYVRKSMAISTVTNCFYTVHHFVNFLSDLSKILWNNLAYALLALSCAVKEYEVICGDIVKSAYADRTSTGSYAVT